MIKNLYELTNISYTIFTIDNLANEWELKSVLENINQIKLYLDNYNFDEDYDINSVIDYFIIDKISKWNFDSRITDNRKEIGNEIVAYCKSKLNKFSMRNIIEFFKGFSYKMDDLDIYTKRKIYDYLPSLCSQLINTDAYKKAIIENPFLVFYRFEVYKKVFNNDKSLYHFLFTDTNIQKFIEDSRLETLISIASDVINHGLADDEIDQRLLSALLNVADQIVDEENNEKPYIVHHRYNLILRFFKQIKSKYYNKLLKYQEKIESRTNDYLSQNGISFSQEINLKPIINFLDNPEVPWHLKMLQLTHQKTTNEWQHFCVDAKNDNQHIFLNLATPVNLQPNEHFNGAVQFELQNLHNFIARIIYLFVNEGEKYKNFCNYVYSFLDLIYKKISREISTLKTEFISWGCKGFDFFFNQECDEMHRQIIIYEYADATVNLTEKLLRLIYCEELERREIYFDQDKAVLNVILNYNDKTNPMIEIFSVDVLQYFQFCLIQDRDKRGEMAGLKLRNKFKHDNYDWDKVTEFEAMVCLINFLSVINGAYLYYYESKK